jgi:phosphatidylglycerol:prolipoprotein diacylglycerol transferase
MFPELFRMPFLDYPVATYGVLLATAMVTAMWVGVRLAAKDGLDRESAYNVALATIGASMIGSKLLLVITEPELLEPSRLLSKEFWSSGGVYFGGFVAAFLGSMFFAWSFSLPWWRLADAFAPAIALGQAIGRLGCFAAGCCWGTECALPWAVEFPRAAHAVTGVPWGVPLHPVQLYESLLALCIFAALMWLRRRRAFTGEVVLAYLVLYSAARFALELWRDDPRGDVLGITTATGLSTSQLISVGCGATGLALLAFYRARARRERAGGGAEPSATAAV